MKQQESKQSALSFEDALVQLENIVKQLEKGELPLEQSLAQFQEGMKLSQLCLEKLDHTEKAIDRIMKEEQGKITEKPLLMPEGDSC